MDSVRLVDQWPVDHAATAVVAKDGTVLGTHGDGDRVFWLASVTKLLTAYATLIAVEEGAIGLDDEAGPEGSTVRHLLAHTSGLAFDEHKVVSAPGHRRLYSSSGFEQLANTVAERSGMPFPAYFSEGLLAPLGMTSTTLNGSAGSGASSSLNDLVAFAAELQAPTLLDPITVDQATTAEYPDRDGVLPGYGHQKPNDWGLGFEVRDSKSPHWTGTTNSPQTFGHFGQSGTFLWVDPELGAACVVLTDRDFGQWAVDAWTPFNDAVVAELRG